MLFAHLKRILGLGKLRLRGPSGAKDDFLLAATAQNLRKLAKLIPLQRRSSPHRRSGSSGRPVDSYQQRGCYRIRAPFRALPTLPNTDN
jgi:hypothetical protein